MEADVGGWWWQVLSGSNLMPVLGEGRAERRIGAVALVEAVILGNEGAPMAMGTITGPGGVMERCRRDRNGGVWWAAE